MNQKHNPSNMRSEPSVENLLERLQRGGDPLRSEIVWNLMVRHRRGDLSPAESAFLEGELRNEVAYAFFENNFLPTIQKFAFSSASEQAAAIAQLYKVLYMNGSDHPPLSSILSGFMLELSDEYRIYLADAWLPVISKKAMEILLSKISNGCATPMNPTGREAIVRRAAALGLSTIAERTFAFLDARSAPEHASRVSPSRLELLEDALKKARAGNLMSAAQTLQNSTVPGDRENAKACKRLALVPSNTKLAQLLHDLGQQLDAERASIRCADARPESLAPEGAVVKDSNMNRYDLNCPHCQQSLEVLDEHLGLLVACPACGGEFQLPESVLDVQSIPAQVPQEIRPLEHALGCQRTEDLVGGAGERYCSRLCYESAGQKAFATMMTGTYSDILIARARDKTHCAECGATLPSIL
jgi:hypothetical protein